MTWTSGGRDLQGKHGLLTPLHLGSGREESLFLTGIFSIFILDRPGQVLNIRAVHIHHVSQVQIGGFSRLNKTGLTFLSPLLVTWVSADQDPPMLVVSGGIIPLALASSNSLMSHLEEKYNFFLCFKGNPFFDTESKAHTCILVF